MICPYCQTPDTKVLDSREVPNTSTIKRKRRCENCQRRFTTLEKMILSFPDVVKADGRREVFNREKALKGPLKSCEKRSISRHQIEAMIESLELKLSEISEKEISSAFIGEYLMKELYTLDRVAYVRFASFYWNFEEIEEFVTELQTSLQ